MRLSFRGLKKLHFYEVVFLARRELLTYVFTDYHTGVLAFGCCKGYNELTATNRLNVLKDIVLYVYENHVTSFSDLVYTAISTSDDWFNIVANYNTLFLNKLVDSEWQKAQKPEHS